MTTNRRRKVQRREVGNLDDAARGFLTGDAAPAATREGDGTPPAPAPAPAPAAPAAPAVPQTGDAVPAELREHLSTIDERLAALAARGPVGDTHDPHPLAQFRSFGDFVIAAYRGDADPAMLTRAWADQTLADNDGLNPPQWSTEVRGIVDLGRPFITALGGAVGAGDSGMTLAWPSLDPAVDLKTLVQKQATEKTEVHSVKVPIKKHTTDLETYAAGSDVALQLIERGSPDYLDALMRVYAAAYGIATDAASVAAAVAADTSPGTVKADFSDLDSLAIAASMKVQAATGTPATVIGVGADLYPALATVKDKNGRPLYPSIGASNADGTLDGNGLALSILGMRAIPIPSLAGKLVITNGLASRWVEDGPRTIAAPDVPKLGRDVAIYGYGAQATYVPGGVVVLGKATA